MKRVIEFPRPASYKEAADTSSPSLPKKLFNIADWKPSYPVRLNLPGPDTFPFCAA